ncbi:MAG: hypothetical protein LBT05_15545 [Planctomycetaceae bacterium]|jgi:hypothetical protein|nr:hypothetical protein [Planctomycetaceae bacterium]
MIKRKLTTYLFFIILFLENSLLLTAEEIYFPKQEEAYYAIPQSWQLITNNADKLNIMQLLVTTAKNGKNGIDTLKGQLSVQYEGKINNITAKEIGFDTNLLGEKPISHNVDFTIDFILDLTNEKTFRFRKETKSSFNTEEQIVKSPNTSPYNTISIVSSNEYIYSFEKEILPTIPELPDYPGTENKRVAWRESPEPLVNRTLVEMIDPYEYFDLKKTWGNVESFYEHMKGRHGNLLKEAALKDISLFESKDEKNNKWYRIFYKVSSGNGFDEVNIFWSQEVKFYPVCYLYTNSSHVTTNLLQVRWKNVNGLLFPIDSYVVSYYNSGHLSYRRKMTMSDIKINEPISPEQFSYSALGLKDDDILVDRTKQTVYTIQNNQPVKLAKFYEKYQTPYERNVNRVRLIIIGIGILMMATGLALRFFGHKKRVR